MVFNVNGKEAESRSGYRYDQCNSTDSLCRMGIFQSDSNFYENDSHGFDSSGCIGKVFLAAEITSSGNNTPQDVLNLIKQLKEQHLKSVAQYEQLIKALLNEVKQEQSTFLDSCQLLEDQLSCLIQKQHKT